MSNSNPMQNDELLLVTRDSDIFPDAPKMPDVVWKERPTGKVVLFNATREVALLGNKVNPFFLLPGGGIEAEESVLDGVRRECREETGCDIEIQDALGITEDFRSRDSKHCISFGYSAKAVSQGTPTFTASEIDIGTYVKWFPLPEAIELLRQQEEKVRAGEVLFYNTCFNTIRDLLFLRRAQELTRN
ncbi:MAG: NUDIX hydrolase [Patescibacteria group bacterium]